MTELEFYLFNNGSYPYVPRAVETDRKSLFVSTPNSMYRPLRGQQVLSEYVDTLVHAEHLGFDGVLTTEQHNGPIGLSSAAMQTAGWVAARTSNIRVGAVGPILNAYASPMRLVEEVNVLDTLSGGRFILGLPMGIGMQYHSYGVTNPAEARGRYREALNLMLRAWTEDGPFEHRGEYFHIPYVNPWPRQMQTPHPEVWIPAAGSRETLELCAEKRLAYQAVNVPWPVLEKNTALFRELCRDVGYEADPRQTVAVVNLHVAETDEKAREEMEPHLMWVFQNFLKSHFYDSFPPGHVSTASLSGMMRGGYRSKEVADTTWEEAVADHTLIAGSPDTVAEKLEFVAQRLQAGRVIVIADQSTMPTWLVRKSLGLLAEEVMPRFRRDGRPVWDRGEPAAGWRTISELAARDGRPELQPRASVAGRGVVEVRNEYAK
ncbi:LLM class flavin-dependent oxidoreductase [Nocardia sp. NPDC059239]|uniref:LLM class flavin-dependent oxidoreductase n=1 Tax=unclassified Nocardia TaxID=2637762 RepID=UPI0036871191